MCINITHLITEAFCYSNNHIVDDCSDGAEGRDIFSATMVELNVDDVLLWVGKGDRKVSQVFGEFACAILVSFADSSTTQYLGGGILTSRSFNSDGSCFDVNFNTFRNLQSFLGMYILHLECVVGVLEYRRRIIELLKLSLQLWEFVTRANVLPRP